MADGDLERRVKSFEKQLDDIARKVNDLHRETSRLKSMEREVSRLKNIERDVSELKRRLK